MDISLLQGWITFHILSASSPSTAVGPVIYEYLGHGEFVKAHDIGSVSDAPVLLAGRASVTPRGNDPIAAVQRRNMAEAHLRQNRLQRFKAIRSFPTVTPKTALAKVQGIGGMVAETLQQVRSMAEDTNNQNNFSVQAAHERLQDSVPSLPGEWITVGNALSITVPTLFVTPIIERRAL